MTTNQIHSSAIIDKGAQIGSGTKIWHWTHVCDGAQIGHNCSLGQNVYIAPNVVIGDNVKIQNNVSIYEGVILENDVFCGPSMVFTNVINPRSQFIRKDQYNKTIVRQGTSLGANCTIVCGVDIGQYAFIAAGAVVTSNISDFALFAGVPAKQVGWMSRFGEKIPVELGAAGNYHCNHTGDKYQINSEHCQLIHHHE